MGPNLGLPVSIYRYSGEFLIKNEGIPISKANGALKRSWEMPAIEFL